MKGKVILVLSATAFMLQTQRAALARSTYSTYASDAITSLINNNYDGAGGWKYTSTDNNSVHYDWGADSGTYTLWFRYKTHGTDSSLVSWLTEIMNTAKQWEAPCTSPSSCPDWSDVPMWDAVANLREYDVVANPTTALNMAEAAFDYLDDSGSSVFATGACPEIYYQEPGGGTTQLKTLETDSNYIKAAILLYDYTNDSSYLTKAKTKYAAVRSHYLDGGGSNLYSVYVFDNGTTCTQVPGRYYASVNGNMIWAGLKLHDFTTGDTQYLNDAIATGNAVVNKLSDANGVYTNLQAENDIVEPLIEGMWYLAVDSGAKQAFAKTWLLNNANAAASAQTSSGAYGRFFDGPPPTGTVTMFMTIGGYALMVAAGNLDPTGTPSTTTAWSGATTTTDDITTSMLPYSITFTDEAIALYGTVGEQCCEAGHARVFIDGTETTDTTGIWQNKSSSALNIPDTVLFSWRWPTPGTHTIQIQPGVTNAKEGGSFVHIQYYRLF